VALSGDAGDELFGGYNRYFWGPRIWRRLSWMPQTVRAGIGAALSSIPVETWDTISRPLLAGVFGSRGISRIGEKLHKLSESIRAAASMEEMYKSLVTGWHDPSAVVLGLDNVTGSGIALDDPLPVEGATTAELRMMYWDSVTYLPDDILCKVDRAAMACGLETRVPFLDHRVATLAWRLPLEMKIRGGEGKRVLRQVLHRHVPKQLIDRAKIGFGIPVGDWLRGPLREWAEDLLRESRLREEGCFRAEVVSRIWNEHLSGRRDHTVRIWTVLMFQAWLASLSRDSSGCAGDALPSR